MKKIVYIFTLIIIVGCKPSTEETIANINGYWEIAQIETAEGAVREYGMSQNIDFFDIETDGKGIRTKVQPDALGAFISSGDSENIDVLQEGEVITLKYSTSLDTWTETVKKATSDELILVNERGIIYTYRAYEPLVLK